MFLQKGDDIWKERRVGENLACFGEDIIYFIGIVTYFVFYQRIAIELQRAQGHVQVRRKDSEDSTNLVYMFTRGSQPRNHTVVGK